MKSLTIAAVLFYSLFSFGKVIKPKTVKEFRETSVMILNSEMSSGGSGSIINSNKNGSLILTNKHVCRVIEQGGVVLNDAGKFEITHYKKYTNHDLCLIKVKENLGVSLILSKRLLLPSTVIYASGHPKLMPHLVKTGHSSSYLDINLVTGLRDCTDDDLKSDNAIYCFVYGGMPVVETFSSVFTSVLIQPGSSGSAVFDSRGELVGVMFAGTGRQLSHGFMVPHIHIHYFLKTHSLYPFVKVGTEVDTQGISMRLFNEKCEDTVTNCKFITDMIGNK